MESDFIDCHCEADQKQTSACLTDWDEVASYHLCDFNEGYE